MIKIDRHISDLLQDNECVIVPKMGGFISTHSHGDNHLLQKFSPSFSEKIIFNVLLNFNDGLLANHIVKYEKLTYNEALKEIDKFVGEFHKEMESGNKFIIEKVGILYKDNGSNFRIEPIGNLVNLPDSDESINTHDSIDMVEELDLYASVEADTITDLVDSNGNTNQFSSTTSHVEFHLAAVKLPETPVTSAHSGPKQDKSITFGKVRIVALILFLIGIILTLYLYFFYTTPLGLKPVSTASNALKNMEQPSEQHAAKSKEPVSPPHEIKENDEGISSNKPVDKEVVLSNSSITPENTMSGTKENKYFIIAGSFKSIDNAKRKLDELKLQGFKNAKIFSDNRGLQLVCYDSFQTLQDAKVKIGNIRENYKEAWIYSR